MASGSPRFCWVSRKQILRQRSVCRMLLRTSLLGSTLVHKGREGSRNGQREVELWSSFKDKLRWPQRRQHTERSRCPLGAQMAWSVYSRLHQPLDVGCPGRTWPWAPGGADCGRLSQEQGNLPFPVGRSGRYIFKPTTLRDWHSYFHKVRLTL